MHNEVLRSAALRRSRPEGQQTHLRGEHSFKTTTLVGCMRPPPGHIALGLGCASFKRPRQAKVSCSTPDRRSEFHEFSDHEALNARLSESQNQMSLEHVDARHAFSCAKSSCGSHPRCCVDRRPDRDESSRSAGRVLPPLNGASIADGTSLALLLQRVAGQDRRAFASLYAASSSKLYGIILRILKRGDVADDILQDVYVRIWERAVDFDSRKGPAIAWMIAIARNRAFDEHRRTAVGLVAADADVANVVSEDKDPLAAAEHNDNLRRLAECLNKLDKNRRDIVLLAYRDGYSRQELSQRLARPIGTIKTWLHHSLMQLKACLGQ
jgi:RNA polymerase sigma-70 factor, ECF subfamily